MIGKCILYNPIRELASEKTKLVKPDWELRSGKTIDPNPKGGFAYQLLIIQNPSGT